MQFFDIIKHLKNRKFSEKRVPTYDSVSDTVKEHPKSDTRHNEGEVEEEYGR